MSASKQHFDVIVIGGDIIGVSTAWHLTRRGVGRVAVLEKGAQVAAGSTGQSSAVVRQRYTNLPLVQLAYASVEMFRNWTETLEISQNRCGFCQVGVVWISDEQVRCDSCGTIYKPGGGEHLRGPAQTKGGHDARDESTR